jgi:class 3 adenylate cyclase/tetratricopeptide (TPR) repeat protein
VEKRESERRQATIIFADISGFTEMSEKLDPEEVTTIMGDCFAVLGAVVSDFGGTVDKYIGDCVMALFGAPRALENAPRRAIEAALRMLAEIETLNQRHKLAKPLGLHIGVNTGEVLSGELGSKEKRDFTVMGDAVNLASRLKDISAPGRILAGPQTWRYARESFRFKPMRPIGVKGKEELVQTYEVVGPEALEAGTTASRMIQSCLVGRERELAAIEARVQDLLGGSGSVITLVGEAGIGKSRLTAELRSRDYMKRLTVLEGRAIGVGRNLSYHPIIDILKSWAGISEDDPEEIAFERLDSAIHAIDPEDADEAVPFVGTLMGYRPSARYAGFLEGVKEESLGKLIVKHSRDIIARASSFRPILFVLEDMQWADESSFEFLKGIVGLSSTHPVMFLYAWRPGYAETTERFRSFLAESLDGKLFDIELPPLGEGRSGELVRNLLRDAGVPQRVIAKIVEKSGGNPFFIEETIRSFIDRGAMDPGKSGPAMAQELESIEIPNSIDAVIMSRIDRLDEALRELLRIASVIGRSFFFRVLARVCRNEGELGTCIEQLEELQIFRHRVRLDEIEFLFKHVLVQETIYRSILLRSRKEIHLNVARAIEELFAGRIGEFCGVLAYHYMQAEDLDKTEKYLEMAGKAAMDSAASSEALVFFQQTLDIYKRKAGKDAAPERLARFERIIGKAYQNKGLMQKALEHYDAALEHYGIRRKKRVGKVVAAAAGFLSILRFLYLPATRSRKRPSEREIEIIRIMNDREWAVANIDSTEFFLSGFNAARWLLLRDPFNIPSGLSLLCIISQLLSVTGLSFPLANKILDLVGPHLKSDPDRSVYSDAENFVNLLSGRRECRYEGELLDSFVHQGDFSRCSLYMAFRGICAICRGDFAEAGRIAARARDIAEAYEDAGSLTKYLENLILSDHVKRTGFPTLENEEALITAAARIGEEAVHKLFVAYKADAIMARGDMRDAKPVIDELVALVAMDRIPLPLQVLPPLMSILSYNTRRYACAESAAERSRLLKGTRPILKGIRRYGPKYAFRYPEALRLAGTFLWLTGRQGRAFALWSEGLRIGRDLKLKPELGRIGFEVARRLSSPGCRRKTLDKLPAASYAQISQELFSEIGLDVDLRELEDWERERRM